MEVWSRAVAELSNTEADEDGSDGNAHTTLEAPRRLLVTATHTHTHTPTHRDSPSWLLLVDHGG